MPDGSAAWRCAQAPFDATSAVVSTAESAGARLPYAAIVGHIRANIARRISVDELAGIACLSAAQFARAFRREHRTTPYRLVLDVRIGHAASMLGAGASLAETALRAGFADQSHFTRHFKRSTGMTPGQYAALDAPSATPVNA